MCGSRSERRCPLHRYDRRPDRAGTDDRKNTSTLRRIISCIGLKKRNGKQRSRLFLTVDENAPVRRFEIATDSGKITINEKMLRSKLAFACRGLDKTSLDRRASRNERHPILQRHERDTKSTWPIFSLLNQKSRKSLPIRSRRKAPSRCSLPGNHGPSRFRCNAPESAPPVFQEIYKSRHFVRAHLPQAARFRS